MSQPTGPGWRTGAGRAPLVVAHRGASAAAPENTLAAFALAVGLGADGVEMDVRLSADGHVVVHHDPVLSDGRVVGHTMAAALPEHVPTLDEALDAADGVLVDVELKHAPAEPGTGPVERLVDAVAVVLSARDPAGLLVTSFHPGALDLVRAALPGPVTGQLATGLPDLAAVADRGHGAVAPHHRAVTGRWVRAAHARGLLVAAWTVDRPGRMRRLAAAGVDAIVTNVVDVGRATLGPP